MLAQCACEFIVGLRCQAEATQEDLLCDDCRAGRRLNACTAPEATGHHRHFTVTGHAKFGGITIFGDTGLPMSPE